MASIPRLAGRVIGERYRVERMVGAGGMGSVWKVQHLESLQDFALKTLHPEHAADKRRLVRFLREVRAGAALNTRHVHPKTPSGRCCFPSGDAAA